MEIEECRIYIYIYELGAKQGSKEKSTQKKKKI